MIRSVLLCLLLPVCALAEEPVKPFFDYLTGQPTPKMIAYTPLGLDPRQEGNNESHPTSAFRADLQALRPAFDGLILYGYHQASTPRILAVAKELKFRAVLLGIWQPKSASELDGVAELVRQFHPHLAMGVIVGNEGITFKRYELDDLKFAGDRLRSKLPGSVPLTTSEPLVGYESEVIRQYGDFQAPNIHPVFDRPQLGPAAAAEWARGEAQRLAAQTGKPTLLKETGFPHGGKEQFTLESQARFWSAYTEPGLLVRSEQGGWVYFGVAFEAFDLPWKSEASGLPVEKNWGLFSTERKPYPALEVWRQR